MSALCPFHQQPDCSPLLNGCSRLTNPPRDRKDEPMTDAEPKVEPAHTVTLTFDQGGTAPMFRCHAPADGMCHAVWTCRCEEWDEGGVDDCKPWHWASQGADDEPRHYGTFDADECGLRDWFENSDEALDGEVTFPVRAEWEGGYFTFHPETKETDR